VAPAGFFDNPRDDTAKFAWTGGRVMSDNTPIEGIEDFFHINVNCSNFARSLEFYQMLGFKVVRDIGEGGNAKLDQGLAMKEGRGRAALLQLGSHKRSMRLDLIEWINPKTEGRPYPHLAHAGIARIAFIAHDVLKIYDQLKARGVETLSEPLTYSNGDAWFCLKDPDGTILELIEFGRRTKRKAQG
jgi:catechol 2,3-dioxygenase-like lactoylglutathione lyase family enzyme